MLKPIKETETLRRYSQPPGAPFDEYQGLSGTISTFPSCPLDVPAATFDSNLKRRQANHQKLIQWIKQNLHPDVDKGRIHMNENCQIIEGAKNIFLPSQFHISVVVFRRFLGMPNSQPSCKPFPDPGKHQDGVSPGDVMHQVLSCGRVQDCDRL